MQYHIQLYHFVTSLLSSGDIKERSLQVSGPSVNSHLVSSDNADWDTTHKCHTLFLRWLRLYSASSVSKLVVFAWVFVMCSDKFLDGKRNPIPRLTNPPRLGIERPYVRKRSRLTSHIKSFKNYHIDVCTQCVQVTLCLWK